MAVLGLLNVSVDVSPDYDIGLTGASMVVEEGELAFIRLEPGRERIPLADVARGLLTPKSGAVNFNGHYWRVVAPDMALRLRGRMGGVFQRTGWIGNLNVDENITLPQRHHTKRPESEIMKEAEALARAFGMDGIPKVRPARLPGAELRRAEWIRAFMGKPLLIILDRPMQDALEEWTPLLIERVEAARRRGTAIIWISEPDFDWKGKGMKPTYNYEMRDSRIELHRSA